MSAGSLLGVRLHVHPSWFVVAAFVPVVLAEQFRILRPDWDAVTAVPPAVGTAVLFFAAVIAHEISHARMARGLGLRADRVTLFALGGVSHMDREPADPRSEFLVGIVGPAASAALGVASLAAAFALGWVPGSAPFEADHLVLVWLGYLNLALAAFNLMPGYPLDGGRVWRAVLWSWLEDERRATRLAARTGQGFAVLLLLDAAVLLWTRHSIIGGVWMALVGAFLFKVASACYSRELVFSRLHQLSLAELVEAGHPFVGSHRTVAETMAEWSQQRHRYILVTAEGRVEGIVTMADLGSVPACEWAHTTMGRVMRPVGSPRAVPRGEEAPLPPRMA